MCKASYWECTNELFRTYAPTLDAFDKLIGIFIGGALLYIAHHANRIAISNFELAKQERESRYYLIDKDKRDVFRTVYNNLTNALSLVLQNGDVGHDALASFWQARDQARLELPQEIKEYTEKLRDAANKAFSIRESYLYPNNREGLPVGEERSRRVDEHHEHISILLDAKPYEYFTKYLTY